MERKKTKETPENIVRRLSREELEVLVISRLEAEDGAMASEVLSRFGRAGNGAEAREIVRALKRNRTGNSYGIIDDAYGLYEDIKELRQRARSRRGKGACSAAFALYMAILELIAPDVWDADDHDGILLESVRETLDELKEMAARPGADAGCLAAIRSWTLMNIDARWARDGDGWDFDLLAIHLAAARTETDSAESLALCESRCSPKDDSFYAHYLADKAGGLMLEALSAPGHAAARAAFIEQHLDLDSVRTAAIDQALVMEDYVRAEDLARDGMKSAEKGNHSGIVHDYARSLVKILEARGDKAEALVLLENWTIEEGCMDWYSEIEKRLPGMAERKVVMERIVAACAKKNTWFAAELCAKEGLFDRLHSLALRDSSIMERYYRNLGARFPESVVPWLEKTIRHSLRETHGRGTYQLIASRVSDYRRVAGAKAAASLVGDLVTMYPRRPAMIEELHKALGS